LRIKGLNITDQERLLALARQGIKQQFTGEPFNLADYHTQISKEKWGCFVTLQQQGKLRGCIGEFESQIPLSKLVVKMAQQAAFHDPRFKPLKSAELIGTKIEISLLTAPKPVPGATMEEKVSKLVPFVDGVILRHDSHKATFLPQVWGQLDDKPAFMSALCRKAGLAADAWQTETLTLFTYRAQHFEE